MITRGFTSQRSKSPRPLPPGQYYEEGFPVLSAGPTPKITPEQWEFTLEDRQGQVTRWSWTEFMSLPQDDIKTDIHCVDKWSKLDTRWKGVSIDVLLSEAGELQLEDYVMAFSYGGYSTNLALDDITEGKAWVAWEFGGKPLEPEHGGPARLLVPQRYFWKSAKWLKGLRFMSDDQPGFWEQAGYHMRGDPKSEERYWGD